MYVFTASILAHEALHVWIKLTKGFPSQIPSQIEEGLCQVVAEKYLNYLSELCCEIGGKAIVNPPPRINIRSTPYAFTSIG